jgi:hypothetical protein
MDTTSPTEASANPTVDVIVPAVSDVPPTVQYDPDARTIDASSSSVTYWAVYGQGETALSAASLTLNQEQGHFLSEPELLELTELERAAESRDPQRFVQLVRAMKWGRRPAGELIRAIDLALAMDLVPLARHLIERGKRLFPNEQRFRQIAAVLAPPVILGARQSRLTGLKESQQWLREHASEYRNQWVAVKAGKFLGAAPTLKNLHERIGPEGKMPDTITVKVLPDGAL